MPENTPQPGSGQGAPDPPSLSDRLAALRGAVNAARLRQAAEASGGVTGSPGSMQGMAAGLRVMSEMVAGVLVGGGLGFGLDRWLGTAPWFLFGGLAVGVAAGFRNVYRLGARPSASPSPERADVAPRRERKDG